MFSSRPLKAYGNSLSSIFPLELSIYDRCAMNCLYCFAMLGKDNARYRQKQMGKERKVVKGDPTDSVINKFRKSLSDNYNSQNWIEYFIHHRYPLVFSNNVDPLGPQDNNVGSTVKLLQFFADVQYPVFFQTKKVYTDETLPFILENKNLAVYVSINSTDDAKTKMIETNATPPSERIEKMRYLCKKGKYVIMAINPWINEVADPIMDMVHLAKDIGCQGVYFDFIHFTDGQASQLKINGKHLTDYTIEEYMQRGPEGVNFVLDRYLEFVEAARECDLNYYYNPAFSPYLGDNFITPQAVGDFFENKLMTNRTLFMNYMNTAVAKYKKPIVFSREELMAFYSEVPYMQNKFNSYDLFSMYNQKVTESPAEFINALGKTCTMENFYRFLWEKSMDNPEWLFRLDGLVTMRVDDALEVDENNSVLYCYYPDLIEYDINMLDTTINIKGWEEDSYVRLSDIDLSDSYEIEQVDTN